MKNKIHFGMLVILFMALVLSFSLAKASNETGDPDYKKSIDFSEGPGFELPESIKIIEEEAFEGTAIVKAKLPHGVEQIGSRAFAKIKTLLNIHIPTTAKTIAASAFSGSDSVTISVASNSYAWKYAKANSFRFVLFETFNANTHKFSNSIIAVKELDAIDTETSEKQKCEDKWQKYEEIKAFNINDRLFTKIQGRAPPIKNC